MPAPALPGRCANEVIVEQVAIDAEVFRSIDVTTAFAVVESGAGRLYGWYLYNRATATRYVHLYNTNNPTVGTTTPWMTLPLPPVSGANVQLPGIPFAGLAVAASTAINATGAPTTNDVTANIFTAAD